MIGQLVQIKAFSSATGTQRNQVKHQLKTRDPAKWDRSLNGVVIEQANSSRSGIRQPMQQEPNEQFVEGFNRGCLRGKTPGVADQEAYCSCLSDAYTSRYNGFALAKISSLSGPTGPKGAELVNLMMSPEMASCTDQ